MSLREGVRVESCLLRDRSCLLVHGDFGPVLEDLALHILSLGLDYDPFTVEILSDGICALGLHLASRPADEYVGWTIQIQKPLTNFFFTGDARTGAVVGRAFLEGVEPHHENVFFSQSKREFGDPQLSTVPVTGVDIFAMVEKFYSLSEQKPARFFVRQGRRTRRRDKEPRREAEAALLISLPGGDRKWLESVDAVRVFRLPRSPSVQSLGVRRCRFRCGCDRQKIGGILVGAYGESPGSLFSKSNEVEVECPRCSARITITRADYERILEESSEK